MSVDVSPPEADGQSSPHSDDLPPALPRRRGAADRDRQFQPFDSHAAAVEPGIIDVEPLPEPSQPRGSSRVAFMRTLVGAGLFGFVILLGYQMWPRQPAPQAAQPAAEVVVKVDVPTPTTPPTAEIMTEIAAIDVPTPAPGAAVAKPSPQAATSVGRLVSTATTVPVAPAPIAFRVAPAPGATAGKPNPLFGPAYDPNDGKPVITCASDPYVSHLTLLQIQAQGLDVKNGFHLGIIPLGLNTVYDLEVDDYAGRVRRGEWDCVLDRVDENAELDIGVITTLTDESAGSNGIWAREITSTYGLAGKRIGYVTNTSSRFFALYATAILPVEQQRTVTLVPFDSPSRAMEGFARNEVDAVSAWQPFLAESEATGGRPVVTTGQLRVIANAIIMSRKSVTERPEAVQAFHRAWYEAVRDQLDKPKEASAAIAAWGSPEWTRVTPDNALSYLRTEYAQVAQATFAQNIALMANPKSLIAQMELSRRVRTLAGSTDVSTVPVKDQIDTRFVQHLANEAGLKSRSAPVNGSFSLAASAVVVGSEASFAELPCTEFTFRPNSVELTPDSIRVLDICVVPAMEQRPTVQLKIVGSSAWPKGSAFSAAEVEQFGLLRARAIASYLIARGIDTSRLQVSGALPPPERREIDDSVLLQRDRNVRMTLLFGGW